MEQPSKRYLEMTQGPLKRMICKMAAPGIASMMVTSIYNMADTYFVGNVGTSATGAVGIVFLYGGDYGHRLVFWSRIGKLYFAGTGRAR